MEFKIGETVFYDWIGSAEKVKIVKCFPNSDRYKIHQETGNEWAVKSDELFRTEKELWESKIKVIDSKIRKLEKTRDECKRNIKTFEEEK